MGLVYTVTRWMILGASACCFRLSVAGTEHVPVEGGCIVASNHVSYLDPPMLGAACPRQVAFLARRTLFDVPFLGWYIRALGAFPVALERTVDIESFRSAVKLLREGRVVGLFPEGTRSADGRLQTPKAGVGRLAIKANVPVIPAYLSGTDVAMPRHSRRIQCARVSVRFGEPIVPEQVAGVSPRDQAQALTERLVQAITELSAKS